MKTLLRIKKGVKIVGIIAIVLFVAWWALAWTVPIKKPVLYGVTFSPFYAEDFGLNWKETYIAMLDDLKFKNIRIPLYWNDTERVSGSYDFSRVDWMMDEAGRRDTKVVLAIGRKLPRWPECHDPEWAHTLSVSDQKARLVLLVKAAVNRYKDHKALAVWQVENEPYLAFGDCPNYDSGIVDEEKVAVKNIDTKHPVMVTDSGELSLWVHAVARADIFGSTMYRSVHNKYFGDITYPLPPSFFRVKRAVAELVAGRKPLAIVIELQGEPWSREATYKLSVDDHYKTMNPQIFQETLDYASNTGFDTFYLWGVEWWYWLKTTQNKPQMWNIVKEAISNTQH
jgi:hypothetical protein